MFWSALGTLVIAIIVAVVVNVYSFINVAVPFFKHHPGTCKNIARAYLGSEDFQILSNGFVFISSGMASKIASPDYWHYLQENNINGRVLFMDLNTSDDLVKELKIRYSDNFNRTTFRPHGLSVLEDKVKGEHLVYVVNHIVNEMDAVEHIEKFKYHPLTEDLEHIKSFSNDLMSSPNDLVVVSEDSFYVTNSVYFHGLFLISIELLFRLPLADVVFFNGTYFMTSVEGVTSTNGIIAATNRNYVYVGMFVAKGVSVYERASDNSLRLVQEVYLGTLVDNFHLSEDGNVLYCANHPSYFKLFNHLINPKHKAPSQLLSLPLRNGLIVEDEITELFYDHGDLITGSSVGAVYKNKLYIGSVLDTFIKCDLPE